MWEARHTITTCTSKAATIIRDLKNKLKQRRVGQRRKPCRVSQQSRGDAKKKARQKYLAVGPHYIEGITFLIESTKAHYVPSIGFDCNLSILFLFASAFVHLLLGIRQILLE